MVNSTISPKSNNTWSIIVEHKEVGILVQDTTSPSRFTVMAEKNSALTGISLGPYWSKQEAMDAIAAHLSGT